MRALLLGTTLALAACAAGSGQGPTSNKATASGKSDSQLICREETPTGSMFSHEVCRTPEQVEENRREGQEMLRRQRGQPLPDPSQGTGR